jgi:hypothetical protein
VLTVKLDGKDITDLMGEERVNELSEKIAESL